MLVGSEMYIRDRCRVGLQPRLLGDVVTVKRTRERMGQPSHVAPVGIDEQLEGRRGHTGTTRRPVSYTHLTLPTSDLG